MTIYSYSDEVKQFITKNVKGRTTKELVKLVNDKFDLGFTDSKMQSFKGNHGLKSGTKVGNPTGTPSKVFPLEIKEFIESNYVGVGPTEMTAILNSKFSRNYKVTQLKAYYKNHKLNSGITGYFEKGSEPWNKGLSVGGWEPTQFKKGQAPINYRPVGSERVNVEGYTEIKVADPNKWRHKHNVIWEQHNGPIPEGHAVMFGDGDRSNLDIDNLILVTRTQLLNLNRYKLIQNDADLTRTAVNVVDVLAKISERKK